MFSQGLLQIWICETLALMQYPHDINKFCKNLVAIYIMYTLHERQSFAHSDLKETLTCLDNVHCDLAIVFCPE